jgi:hypothetical protein
MDPRVKTPSEGLKAQFEMEMKIVEAMQRDFEDLTEVQKVRKALKQISSTANLQSQVGEVDKKLSEVEGTAGGYGAQYLSTPAGRGLARLNSGLSTLLAIVDSADDAPTTQAIATFAEVQRTLDEQLAHWAEVRNKDLPVLNQQLKQAGVTPIEVPAQQK